MTQFLISSIALFLSHFLVCAQALGNFYLTSSPTVQECGNASSVVAGYVIANLLQQSASVRRPGDVNDIY
uniref:hypothetical protein n=1 Tax=Xylella fastidiosa TaxID=2371 RepID=UPI000FFEA362|nr:hypothetical protein [Xylella fastidiosa]RWA44714.1 hypothetical protein XfCFBP8356_05220 [Xylella fastidiosa subsp. sandyi]